MDSNTVNMIIKCVVTVLGCVLTTFVIPMIQIKVDASKLSQIEKYTELAVRCAEMLFTPEEWREKKQYVLEYITEKVNDIGADMTSADINAMIEGIVNSVKRGEVNN